MNLARIGRLFFKIRGYMGIPVFLTAIIFADKTHSFPALGFFLVIIGEFIRIWSVSYSGVTTRSRQITAVKLATKGPYSMTRNPIYIGNFTIGLGIVLISGALFPYFLIAYVVLFWLEYIPIIHAEEEFLREKFGEDFKRYVKDVPRILPDLQRFKSSITTKPNWNMAVRSEKSTFILIGSTLVMLFIRLIF